jgi:hypothetical protein
LSGRHGRDHMVVEFTTTYAISAYGYFGIDGLCQIKCSNISYVDIFSSLNQGSRWRAIQAKKSPCGCSLHFVLVPKEKWKSPCNFFSRVRIRSTVFKFVTVSITSLYNGRLKQLRIWNLYYGSVVQFSNSLYARQNKESEKGLFNTNKQKTNTRTYVYNVCKSERWYANKNKELNNYWIYLNVHIIKAHIW